MRRLDSRFLTLLNKILVYIFLVLMWWLSVAPFINGDVVKEERVKPMLFYVLPPVTISLLWFFSRFKQVTLDGGTLIIRGFQREARVPVSQIKQIYKRTGEMLYISIVFKSGTGFGKCVRIFTSDDDKAEKLLRAANRISLRKKSSSAGGRTGNYQISSKTSRNCILASWGKNLTMRFLPPARDQCISPFLTTSHPTNFPFWSIISIIRRITI
jgi:hypothetical protein